MCMEVTTAVILSTNFRSVRTLRLRMSLYSCTPIDPFADISGFAVYGEIFVLSS